MNKPILSVTDPIRPAFGCSGNYPACDEPSATGAPSEVVVLLVDDQLIVSRAVRQLLAEDRDIAFHYCSSPHDALEAAKRLRPTVILQDLVMPGISGLELVREYRATPATAEIPIVVLSAREEPIAKSQAFAEGANDYLVKLPDRIELIARVRYHSKAYRALAALRDRATRDALTGVWNRGMIFETLTQELARAGRERTPLAIVMVDLDKFKSINDSYGHAAGDAVVQQASHRLSANIRSYDHVGRFGGDEFLIVLSNCDREQAQILCERLRQAVVGEPMNVEGMELHVSCSLGVTFTDGQAEISVAALMQSADEALYLAKKTGRNRVQVTP